VQTKKDGLLRYHIIVNLACPVNRL